MKKVKAQVKEVEKVSEDTFLMSFDSSYLAKKAKPGNFLHIKVDSVILRRPLSIHKVGPGDKIYVLVRIKGRGTKALLKVKKGNFLDLIGPLGEGFKVDNAALEKQAQNILIAGGIGVAPLLFLAKELNEKCRNRENAENIILLGAKTKKEILCEKDFKKENFKIKIATDDGSKGFRGSVLGLLKKELVPFKKGNEINIYACGPEAMFLEMNKILKKYPNVNCQVSFEQFMGCGIGTCCGCVVKTKKGYKKVCKDGPVFNIKDVW